jgi:hypothetical protein
MAESAEKGARKSALLFVTTSWTFVYYNSALLEKMAGQFKSFITIT